MCFAVLDFAVVVGVADVASRRKRRTFNETTAKGRGCAVHTQPRSKWKLFRLRTIAESRCATLEFRHVVVVVAIVAAGGGLPTGRIREGYLQGLSETGL